MIDRGTINVIDHGMIYVIDRGMIYVFNCGTIYDHLWYDQCDRSWYDQCDPARCTPKFIMIDQTNAQGRMVYRSYYSIMIDQTITTKGSYYSIIIIIIFSIFLLCRVNNGDPNCHR
jgi:hypothetical protein